MTGRFFALEMGCPDDDGAPASNIETVAYLNEDGSLSTSGGPSPDGATMICECRGLGCNKCKRKKAKVITLTGNQPPVVPVMNMPYFQPSMIMLGRRNIF